MSDLSHVSLDDLEARCVMLQRRVSERAATSNPTSSNYRNHSPPRSTASGATRALSPRGAGPSTPSLLGSRPSPASASGGRNVSPTRRSNNSSPTNRGAVGAASSAAAIGVSPSRFSSSTHASPAVHHHGLNVSSSSASAITPSYQPTATTASCATSTVSVRDMQTAVVALERERTQLLEKLRSVDQHIAVYRACISSGQQNGGAISYQPTPVTQQQPHQSSAMAPVAPPSVHMSGFSSRYSPTRQQTTAVASQQQQSQQQRPPSPPRSAPVSARTISPTRSARGGGSSATSGVGMNNNDHGAPGAVMPTDQIYEELRLIRKAREEREAQRTQARNSALSPTRL